MKYAKMLGLVVAATAAMMAFAGVASANVATSPAGTVYTGAIKAQSEGVTKLTSSFFGVVECKNSTVEGKVEKHGAGVPVSGKLSGLTFTECTGGKPTSPVAKPGSLSVETTATVTTPNGTAKSSGAEVIIHETAVGTCTFTTSNTDIGTLTGSKKTGSTATLDIGSSNIPQTGSNPFCPSSAVWTGSYSVTTPDYLDIS